MTVTESLARLKALQPASRRPITTSVGPWDGPRGLSPAPPAGAERLCEILGAQPQHTPFGEHLGLRRWFSEPIGAEPAPLATERFDAAALRLIAPALPSCANDPENWLFFDTETTGLAGGTGTYPFLVGVAWWDAGGLEVEQFFMREQSEEHSLLVTLAERIAERPVIVSFNGKSFDWPLLETRYRMTRVIQPPEPRAHIDFLHPARNLWRLRLGSVRLRELEKHVLGWSRGADVISELIPQIYFDYLRGGPPEPLVPVFLHNQMDLRGLAALAIRVLGLLENPATAGRDPLEIFGLSRLCERRGEPVRARQLYELSIAGSLPSPTSRMARRSLARLARRAGDHHRACQLWEQMLGSSPEGLEAYEQLAIHYEHRLRKPDCARRLARRALIELRHTSRSGSIASSTRRAWRLRFQRRLARLERKVGATDTLELESKPASAESKEGDPNMPESDSTVSDTQRISDQETKPMAGVTDPYLREQLEKRRAELKSAISVVSADEAAAAAVSFVDLLHQVDEAVQRMDEGSYGICESCRGTVERERLIADPLVQLCLDCLSDEEQRALERDLELASRIQRGLLPQADLRFRDWRIHYRYKPAGVVSGDYCDLIPPSTAEGKLIFLIGDVAGKGVAASLLMTHLHAMFRSLASIGLELDKLLEMANRLFCESTIAGQYATLICGSIGRNGEIEIASAGHNPALLVSKDCVKQMGATGLPLGLFQTSPYAVSRARLDLNETLLLYTDGISEAHGASGNEYGISALSVAAGKRYGWTPQELVTACLSDVQKHSAGVRQADDQTLMAIQRSATAAASFND